MKKFFQIFKIVKRVIEFLAFIVTLPIKCFKHGHDCPDIEDNDPPLYP